MLTVGVDRYFSKQALKLTTDVGVALDEVSSNSCCSRGHGWYPVERALR